MILPSREEFTALAADHDVVPVAREVYADLATPISAFLALADGAEHAFLLESVIGGERLGRYSFLGRRRRRRHQRAAATRCVVENGGLSGELADDPLRVVARELAAGQRGARAGAAAVRGRRRGLRRLRDGDHVRAGSSAFGRRARRAGLHLHDGRRRRRLRPRAPRDAGHRAGSSRRRARSGVRRGAQAHRLLPQAHRRRPARRRARGLRRRRVRCRWRRTPRASSSSSR